MIDALERAVAAESWRTAIELALAAWQERRAPELADLVEALGQKLASPPFPRASAPVFHELWLIALAADPIANLGPALATLTRLLPLGKSGPSPGTSSLRRKYAPWLARIAALRVVDDPRVATGLVAIVRDMPFVDTHSGEETVYDPVLDALERLGDVRHVEVLRALAKNPPAQRAWLREIQATELRWLAESLEEQEVVSLDHEERPRVAALLASVSTGAPAAPVDDAALLALVLDAPDDDGPREVLADLWLERGDPRGELVILQLKEARGAATDADRKRARAIVRAHEKDWLGPLATVTMKRQYARGFLDRIELCANSVASTDTWASAVGAPELRTVRFIEPGRASTAHYRSFVRAAPNLRAARVDETLYDALLAEPPARLTHLRLGFALTPKVVDDLAGRLPSLVELTIRLGTKNVEAQQDLAAKLVARRPPLRVSALGPTGGLSVTPGRSR